MAADDQLLASSPAYLLLLLLLLCVSTTAWLNTSPSLQERARWSITVQSSTEGPSSFSEEVVAVAATAEPDEEVAGKEAASREAAKKSLFKLCTGLNRGLNAREDENRAAVALVESLEQLCPPKDDGMVMMRPADGGAAPIGGEWKLIYTTALDVLTVGLTPGVEVGQIYQNISPDLTEVVNIIELQPSLAALNGVLGSSLTTFTVRAKATVEGIDRLRIAFQDVSVQAETLFGTQLSTLPIPEALRRFKFSFPTALRGDGGDPSLSSGYFTTTFLDDDLRISRGNNGALFVLVREAGGKC